MIYLNVPYAMKDIAKAHGAKWNAVAKKWYVVGEVPLALRRFMVQAAQPAAKKAAPRQRVFSLEQRAKYAFMRGMP